MFKRGISLRRANILMLIVSIILSVGLIIAMNQTTNINKETNVYTQKFIEWRSSSYDLQRASDYLTEMMQDFTVTGDRKYLENYFTEAKVTKRRENALQILGQDHARSAAYRDLSAAMDESVSLMEREYYAARLTIMAYGYDLSEFPEEIQDVNIMAQDSELSSEQLKETATLMMHGNEYRKRKEVISSHMESCLHLLDEEMKEEQAKYAEKLREQVVFEHILTVFIIVMLLGVVLLTYRLVILPLKNSVDLIRDDEDLPVKGAYEIRFLAKTYNLIHYTNMQSKEKLSYEATHDKQTGLYNRRGYDFLMENLDLETSALLLFDIDKFKFVNDNYGHDVGDRILTRVGNVICENFRSQDYVCRIGGDEMAVIMVHTDSSLVSLLDKKIKKINKLLSVKQDNDPVVSVSVGVAFGENGIDVETLFKRADNCLYEVKNGTKKEVSFYISEKDARKKSRELNKVSPITEKETETVTETDNNTKINEQ